MARDLTDGSPWKGFIPRQTGWAPLTPETLPGTEEVLSIVRKIALERRETPRVIRKSPYAHLQDREDFRTYPELLDFALSDELLHIVSDYYRVIPQLKNIRIWLSNPVDRLFGSQLYHRDKPESGVLSLFLNVEDNPPGAGLTTFLPADVSRRVAAATDYDRVYFRGKGRLSDDRVYAVCAPSEAVVLDGRRGHGGIVDTTACFHYGSRCTVGQRLIFSIKYMIPLRAVAPRTLELYDGHPYGDDPLRRLVLQGAQPA